MSACNLPNSKFVALQQEMLTYEVLITHSPQQLSPCHYCHHTSDPVQTSQHRASFQSTVPPENWTPTLTCSMFNFKILVSQETRFIWVHINKLSAIVRVVRRSAERVYSPGFLRRCCGHQALSSGRTRVKCQKCPIKPSTNNQSLTGIPILA